ncbi:MAG: 16S rRNA (cytosine(1402)-N(4))-methyltransferase RsmH [Planctomycetota bacterium]
MEHTPVLVAEVLSFLTGPAGRVVLDATVGTGGHALSLLEAEAEGEVIGIDRDAEMLEVARRRLGPYGRRARLHHACFADLGSVLDEEGVAQVGGVLFDLGVSSPQLDLPERGFTFREDGPLDMRMDRSRGATAADLVQHTPERQLADLLFDLGGEWSARRVARAIVERRRRRPIRTTGDLAALARGAVRGRSRIDRATRTFQALRMAVNDEPGQLARGLAAAAARVRPGGRMVVISFHSGEDRVVKHFLREEARLEVLTRKPVRPSARERQRNPRARSARLRAAERRPAGA